MRTVEIALANSYSTGLSPGAERTVQKRKRRKDAGADHKNSYSPHEGALERLRLFYHRE